MTRSWGVDPEVEEPGMEGTEPGSVREEAERLVATALAAVRLATSGGGTGLNGAFGPLGEMISGVLGHAEPRGTSSNPYSFADPSHAGQAGGHPGGPGLATGSAECCVCPVCRTITALRDPSPEFADRLATGVGDFAIGVASLMRAFSTVTRPTEGPEVSEPVDVDGAGSGTHDAEDAARPTIPAGRLAVEDEGDAWREATRTTNDPWLTAERDVWAAATRADAEDRSTGVGSPAAGTPQRSGTPADDRRPVDRE